jgi:hypothetical protein
VFSKFSTSGLTTEFIDEFDGIISAAENFYEIVKKLYKMFNGDLEISYKSGVVSQGGPNSELKSIGSALQYISDFIKRFFNSLNSAELYGRKWTTDVLDACTDSLESIVSSLALAINNNVYSNYPAFFEVRSGVENVLSVVKEGRDIFRNFCVSGFEKLLAGASNDFFTFSKNLCDFSSLLIFQKTGETHKFLDEVFELTNKIAEAMPVLQGDQNKKYCLHMEHMNALIKICQYVADLKSRAITFRSAIGLPEVPSLEEGQCSIDESFELIIKSVSNVNLYLTNILTDILADTLGEYSSWDVCDVYGGKILCKIAELGKIFCNFTIDLKNPVLSHAMCLYNDMPNCDIDGLILQFTELVDKLTSVANSLQSSDVCVNDMLLSLEEIYNFCLFVSESIPAFKNGNNKLSTLQLANEKMERLNVDTTHLIDFIEQADDALFCLSDFTEFVNNIKNYIGI